ncbi:hypothetical protein FH589_11895 [Leptospira interrogans]|uniref:Uncharacterized protein n=1 Tax=Leptospira interrogans serovar Zanoni str. LT2156 TaxID=1001601 RepID=M6HCA9_LEPIR|nr:hypothetical protein [Leptospira interrogans]EMM94943.1 hypothetical protein LEP1GSC158_2035 [Leptospira interrogans serovar Zanoni str. LT2156]KAA1266922.1 hypothetical protein C5473_01770 [Leptospira interrogans serovar Weerasinghe]KAA1288207.1 hypothetical protein C4X99_21815 [Leptospira interrogans serovar Geyaweera]QCO37197.1 hypothetical protein E4412_08250 [Leptospira interrogans]QCO41295.1 hypothetical protein E4413_10485 [Leptospira interrogans]
MYIYFENLRFPWRTKFSYRLPYFRKVQTTNELRKTFDTDWELEDGSWIKVQPRRKRSYRMLPTHWDDKSYSRDRNKNWKELRKTKWKNC